MGRFPVQNPLGARPGLGTHPRKWGSRWPSGQTCTNAVTNIRLVRLSPWEWPKVRRGTAKIAVKKKNEVIQDGVVICGGRVFEYIKSKKSDTSLSISYCIRFALTSSSKAIIFFWKDIFCGRFVRNERVPSLGDDRYNQWWCFCFCLVE